MIGGTQFTFEPASLVPRVCADRCPWLATGPEIDEIQAQCEANKAWCLRCPDGVMVVELRPHGDALEFFIWIAVAWRRGAVARQIGGLEKLARDLGARTIAFQSRRVGWERRLGPQWYRRAGDVLVKELT
jgi:hypothetical protein